jgi:hypothetical protein
MQACTYIFDPFHQDVKIVLIFEVIGVEQRCMKWVLGTEL